MHGSLLRGLSLNLSNLNFLSIIFFMEFEVGHLKEPFFLSVVVIVEIFALK